MKDGLKYGLLAGILIFQVALLLYFIIYGWMPWFLLLFYVLSMVWLVIVLIRERIQEKKEEETHDYRDY